MPFDFIDLKYYSVDYEKLFEEFNKHKIIDDINLQNIYLSKWKDVLKKLDSVLLKEISNPNKKYQLMKTLELEPDVFQLPIYYGDVKIYVQFRITYVNRIMEPYNNNFDTVSISEFCGEESQVQWTPLPIQRIREYSKVIKNRLEKNEPIIVVPFYNKQKYKLVIDGNHRLTYLIENDYNEVKVLFIHEESVLDAEIFVNGFDRNFYIMHNEFSHLQSLTCEGNLTAREVLAKSYLSEGRFKFGASSL